MEMDEYEKRIENCKHVWVYGGTSFDDTFMRCPYCGFVRLAMPGETAHLINREMKTGPDRKEGGQDG